MARQIAKELGLKKTMVTVAELLIGEGITLSEAVIKCMQPVDGSTSSAPRAITILKDIEGVQLGRQCSVTGLWFANDKFNKGTTCVKFADAAKGKLYNESKTIEKEAMTLIDEAREITDVKEKVAKFEAYDKKLQDAKAHRAKAVAVTPEMKEGGVETIDALAKALKVPVNPVKPAEPETTEA